MITYIALRSSQPFNRGCQLLYVVLISKYWHIQQGGRFIHVPRASKMSLRRLLPSHMQIKSVPSQDEIQCSQIVDAQKCYWPQVHACCCENGTKDRISVPSFLQITSDKSCSPVNERGGGPLPGFWGCLFWCTIS
jgi:hypothetical protein